MIWRVPKSLVGSLFSDRLSLGIIGFTTAIVVGLWVALDQQIAGERTTKVSDVMRENANLARVFEEHTLRTLGYVDEIVSAIQRQYEKQGISFDLPSFYRELKPNPAILRNVVITDNTGLVVLGNLPGSRVSLADREHVKVHAEVDSKQLFISRPVLGRVNRQWSIVATRRANAPDGALAGTVGVAIDPFYFSNFYRELDLGAHGVVTLIGTADGVVRARLAKDSDELAQNVLQSSLFRNTTLNKTSSFVAASAVDGIERIYSSRKMTGYPLVVVVGTSLKESLSDVASRAKRYRVILAVSSVLIGAFALLLLITNFRRHLAQESLRASEDKFSKAFRSSPLFISITTQAEGRYIEVNEAFERGIGYGRAEVIGRTSREIGLWRHSEDRERAVALLMKSGKISQFEVQVRNKSGEWMMCELWGEPITIGGERCVIWVAYDISARKKVELEILQLNKSLEQRVRERTAELEALTVRLGETNARLEETNAEQEAFVYSISHDFKAPIRAISGFASLLRERKTLRSEEESTQYLDRILTNAKRMGGLLEDLLDLSRYSTQEFNKKAFDMQAKVGSIISELAGEASGVKFEVGELPQATGDPILVRQVWINLISNAIKYSSKASEPVVRIGFENGRYFVADNGAGFDMAYAEKLFKLFSRLHTDAEYSGTGVGLAIVKRIVERHGGQVEATGTVGWGARFSFTLPN